MGYKAIVNIGYPMGWGRYFVELHVLFYGFICCKRRYFCSVAISDYDFKRFLVCL